MSTLSTTQIATIVRGAGWSGNDVVIGTAVALAESGGRTDIISPPNTNGTYDRGLFQINTGAWPQFTNYADPIANAQFAHDNVFKVQGWLAWSAYKSGAYQNFMTQAMSAYAATAGNANTREDRSVTGYTPDLSTISSGLPTATATATTSSIAGILSKSLWVRIGIGALGAGLMFAGFKVVKMGEIL